MKIALIRPLAISFVIALAITGCAAPSLVPVWRPWTRTVGSGQEIQPAAYTLILEGDDEITVGQESPVRAELARVIDGMLQRRGFVRSDSAPEYEFTLRYRAGVESAMQSTTLMENRSSASSFWTGMAMANASSRKRSLGVAIAALIGMAASSASNSTVVQSNVSETRYSYSIALTVRRAGGDPLWQGEAVWHSEGLDIIAESGLPLQLLASELPSRPVSPEIRRVKEDRAATFYELFCKDRWFSSPALPYRIRVERSSYRNPIENEYAYAAYVDLLEHAEISVPVNFRYGEDDYTDVADPHIWKKVLLGGVYLIGPLKEERRILITLETNATGGYDVRDARVATEEEYRDYETRLAGWKAALAEYYAVFD